MEKVHVNGTFDDVVNAAIKMDDKEDMNESIKLKEYGEPKTPVERIVNYIWRTSWEEISDAYAEEDDPSDGVDVIKQALDGIGETYSNEEVCTANSKLFKRWLDYNSDAGWRPYEESAENKLNFNKVYESTIREGMGVFDIDEDGELGVGKVNITHAIPHKKREYFPTSDVPEDDDVYEDDFGNPITESTELPRLGSKTELKRLGRPVKIKDISTGDYFKYQGRWWYCQYQTSSAVGCGPNHILCSIPVDDFGNPVVSEEEKNKINSQGYLKKFFFKDTPRDNQFTGEKTPSYDAPLRVVKASQLHNEGNGLLESHERNFEAENFKEAYSLKEGGVSTMVNRAGEKEAIYDPNKIELEDIPYSEVFANANWEQKVKANLDRVLTQKNVPFKSEEGIRLATRVYNYWQETVADLKHDGDSAGSYQLRRALEKLRVLILKTKTEMRREDIAARKARIDQLRKDRDAIRARNDELRKELEKKKARNDELRKNLDARRARLDIQA